jgi:Ser/Thr protein kinase RdoA (MazF antagonist)
MHARQDRGLARRLVSHPLVELHWREALEPVEVRLGSRHGVRREIASSATRSVNRIRVGGTNRKRQPVERNSRIALPPRPDPLRPELDRESALYDPTSTPKTKPEKMPMWPQLDLEIALVIAQQEEFDDLELPESLDGSRRKVGGWIAVVGRIHFQFQHPDRSIDGHTDAGGFVRFERFPVPGALDLEVDVAHLYTSSMVDPAPRDPRDASATDWLDGSDPAVLPREVRRGFPALDGPIEVRPLHGGLLHQSFHLRAGDVEYVLQHVSDVFASEIHENIQAVTTHLGAHGIPCAPLLPTRDGEFSLLLENDGRWRLMPHLGGASFDTLRSIAQAHSAGELVGRFHAAMRSFDGPLAPIGIHYRDTSRYLEAMQRALDTHREHRLRADMKALALRVSTTFEGWGPPPDVPDRVIHGDLKLANLLFESAEPGGCDIAFALVDLDTLMRGPLWMELGDAWRSWCYRPPESDSGIRFDLEFFEASLAGFLEGYGDPIPQAELDSLGMAPERITLELCARFVTDALEESYFGWDETRFVSRGDHNAARADEQWRLYEAMLESRDAREMIVQRLTSR